MGEGMDRELNLDQKRDLVRQRILSGMTQGQVAMGSGLSESVVRRIERGDNNSKDYWDAYAEAVTSFKPTEGVAVVQGRVSAAIRRFMSGNDTSIGLDLGRYIDEYRSSMGLDREKLADILGLGSYQMHSILHGKMNLSKVVRYTRQHPELFEYVSHRVTAEKNVGVMALLGIAGKKSPIKTDPPKTVAAVGTTTLSEILTALEVKTTASITINMVEGAGGDPVYLIHR